jgi:DNA-binding response OmpR family regulator
LAGGVYLHLVNPVMVMTAVLVAEHDTGICDLLTDVLEAEFAAIVRCERTGGRALQAIETVGFDLAIIDANMPEVSGYELAKFAANRKIPTLLSSGHPDADAKLRGAKCPYLAKPYRIAELTFKVSYAITHAAENISRVKASLARLTAATEGLQAEIAESRRLIDESNAILAGFQPSDASAPLDAVSDWLGRLGSAPKRHR